MYFYVCTLIPNVVRQHGFTWGGDFGLKENLIEGNITFFNVISIDKLADDVQRQNTSVNNSLQGVSKT